MGLRGKLVSKLSVKCSTGDVFQLLKLPKLIPSISPESVQNVDLLAGQWGTVGSIVIWTSTTDGEKKVAKDIVEAVDEKNKSITYKMIEGDLMESYNAIKISFNVDANGEDNLVTTTLEYEKKSEAVPDPNAAMNIALAVIKDIERHHLLVPN